MGAQLMRMVMCLLMLPPLLGAAPAASMETSCEGAVARAGRLRTIPVEVLYAIGLTETGRAGRLQPYALNIDGRAVFPHSLGEAVRAFHEARASGAKFIDVGCMQINYRFHHAAFASLEAMFEPALNVDYAARFLLTLREREASWTMAVARYNAGPNNNPAQKRYVCAVIANLVRAGLGAWTAGARTYCEPP